MVYLIADSWVKERVRDRSEFRVEIESILGMNDIGSIAVTLKGDSDWSSYIHRAMASINAADRIIKLVNPYGYGSFEGNIELNYALLIGRSVEVEHIPDTLIFKEENNHEERH